MRTDTTILSHLNQKFQWMHAYRRRLLCELTLTLVRSGRGWLTALGRDLRSTTHAMGLGYLPSSTGCIQPRRPVQITHAM